MGIVKDGVFCAFPYIGTTATEAEFGTWLRYGDAAGASQPIDLSPYEGKVLFILGHEQAGGYAYVEIVGSIDERLGRFMYEYSNKAYTADPAAVIQWFQDHP